MSVQLRPVSHVSVHARSGRGIELLLAFLIGYCSTIPLAAVADEKEPPGTGTVSESRIAELLQRAYEDSQAVQEIRSRHGRKPNSDEEREYLVKIDAASKWKELRNALTGLARKPKGIAITQVGGMYGQNGWMIRYKDKNKKSLATVALKVNPKKRAKAKRPDEGVFCFYQSNALSTVFAGDLEICFRAVGPKYEGTEDALKLVREFFDADACQTFRAK